MTISSFWTSLYATKRGVSAVRVEAAHLARKAEGPIPHGPARADGIPVQKPRIGNAVRIPPVSAPSIPIPIAGKGLWIWEMSKVEGGDPKRIIARAKQVGLSHMYVRSGSTDDGLTTGDLDRIVPAAHAAGIRVIAWDFTRLVDPYADARRLVKALDHRVPGGDKVDGVAADLETGAEGVKLTPMRARIFAGALAHARPKSFKVLVPPKPSAWNRSIYPYDIIRSFNAVAPMDYWIDDDPVGLARQSIAFLKRFGKPIAPIGQAYDPALDGGPAGAPKGHTLQLFAAAARQAGAVGVSFWSWQHATLDHFRSITRIPFPDR